jgi:hypothetical protein
MLYTKNSAATKYRSIVELKKTAAGIINLLCSGCVGSGRIS